MGNGIKNGRLGISGWHVGNGGIEPRDWHSGIVNDIGNGSFGGIGGNTCSGD